MADIAPLHLPLTEDATSAPSLLFDGASPKTRPSSPLATAAAAAAAAAAVEEGRGDGALRRAADAGGADSTAAPQAAASARAPVYCLILAAMCLGSMLLQAAIFRKFTPVYTETECGHPTAVLDRMDLGVTSIDIGMQIEVSCRNPNPYGIEILASTPGQVFVQIDEANRIIVGQLDVVPGSNLGEYGDGVVRVRMDTKLKGTEAERLLPHFLSDSAVPIMMQLQFNVGVAVSFGLMQWSVAAPFKKACGLNMAGVLVNQFLPTDNSERSNRLGPLVCRDGFDGLREQLPPVGDKSETPEDGNMGFTAAQVAPQEVFYGEMLKNVSLGISFSSSLLLFVIFSLGSLATRSHPGGFSGLTADLRASRNCFSWRVLSGNARNGAVLLLAKFGVLRPEEGWLISQDALTPPPRDPREAEASRCGGGSGLGALCCCCLPRAKDRAASLASTGSDGAGGETPANGARWLRKLLGGGSTPKVATVGQSAGASGEFGARTFSSGYHRLSTVAVDAFSPPKSPRKFPADSPTTASSSGLSDRPVRSKTAPLLTAVMAKRADLMEAPLFDDERPSSPPPPFQHRQYSKNSVASANSTPAMQERRTGRKQSSAAYMPVDEASPSVSAPSRPSRDEAFPPPLPPPRRSPPPPPAASLSGEGEEEV